MEAKLGPDGAPDSVSVPDVGLHTADIEVIGVGIVRDLFAENMGKTVTNKAIVAALRSALPGLRTRRYNSIGRRGIASLQGDASPGARFVNQIGRRASGWVLEPKYTTDEMGTSEWSGTPREKRHVIGAPPQPPVLQSLVSRPGPEQSTFSLRSTGRAPMPSGTQRPRKTPANPHDSHEATLQAVQTALKILQKTA